MVLGLRSKHRRGASVRVTYIVHIHEIRPWPPSESLRSIQMVLLQWENGNDYSGSFLSTARDSKLVFNESFKLPLILYQDRKAHDKFQKNHLEFSLFLPRKDKAKGQLLGTAVVNLADYGVIERTLSINASVNFKKSSGKSVQPALAISLEPVKENSSNTSPNVGLSREQSLDNDNDDDEIASFTDDDASSQSSRTAGSSTVEVATSSPSQSEKNGNGHSGFVPEQSRNVRPVTTDVLSDSGNQVTDDVSFSKFYERSTTAVKKNSETPIIRPSHSSISRLHVNGMPNTILASSVHQSVSHKSDEVIADSKYRNTEKSQQSVEGTSFERFSPQPVSADSDTKVADNTNSADSLNFHDSQEKELQPENVQISDPHVGLVNVENKIEPKDSGLDDQIMEEMKQFPEKKLILNLSDNATKGKSTTVSNKEPEATLPISNEPRIKHVKSLRVHGSVKGNGLQSGIYAEEKALDPDIPNGCQEEGEPDIPNGCQEEGELDTVVERKEPAKDELAECRTEWKARTEMFEEELREAAAAEVGLYSVVAEHASSGNKVHAPARRLSRFYSNACKAGSQAKRASAARAAVSGLVLVSKACGHDVPRLTFWLSNTIMLRAIVSQIAAELPHSDGQERKSNGTGSELTGRLPHEREDYYYAEKNYYKNTDESDDREDISTFIIALEKVESWLFSRIVESLWWQTFTPHMQPTVAVGCDATSGSATKKTYGRRSSLGNYEQGNFSAELWKKAFKDACERLCPIRAGGLDCGCLSVLVRLVMEQLVNRLDMAMFNALLRESAEEMPTDPVSDPISDPKVLPIPAGKSSFGAGVELKNAIGTWSRWLTDLFGLEDDSTEHIDESPQSFKAFRLLHALSDLMMLPLGMLADAPTRKEVCPMFGPTIIKRVLNSFVPDEFSPDPIPQNVIDALDTEEVSDASDDILANFPCTASPTKYSPPPAALLTCVGEVGSQVLQSSRLSTLKKSYISDDELEELDSPFTSIIPDSFQGSALAKLGLLPKSKGGRDIIRYKLLREIWKDDE